MKYFRQYKWNSSSSCIFFLKYYYLTLSHNGNVLAWWGIFLQWQSSWSKGCLGSVIWFYFTTSEWEIFLRNLWIYHMHFTSATQNIWIHSWLTVRSSVNRVCVRWMGSVFQVETKQNSTTPLHPYNFRQHLLFLRSNENGELFFPGEFWIFTLIFRCYLAPGFISGLYN